MLSSCFGADFDFLDFPMLNQWEDERFVLLNRSCFDAALPVHHNEMCQRESLSVCKW